MPINKVTLNALQHHSTHTKSSFRRFFSSSSACFFFVVVNILFLLLLIMEMAEDVLRVMRILHAMSLFLLLLP